MKRGIVTRGLHDITRKPRKDVRVSFRMTDDLALAVEDLEQWTSNSGPSAVLREALVVYHTLVMEKRKGNEPMVMTGESGLREGFPIFGN